MAVQTTITSKEFLELPESNLPTELINGEVIVSPSPEVYHQDVVGHTYLLLMGRVPSGKVYISPLDVYLDDQNVVQPDVLWVAEGSKCVVADGKRLKGGPDLVVEVLSPNTARFDKKEKFRLYEKYGVREYWMVDPQLRLIEVWQRREERFDRLDVYGVGEQFNSPLLGSIDMKAVFPD
jgi:Uma2 family endonuclease